ncbi:hypothetical protein A3A49_01765 [Candidatus Curtissbacteria bacterium RIFCSPLOWO2_01_FULL_38_11b]|uniref:Gram-positive cocci surface proteins LPxTG domain-containing protein n=1 Tax=Candidatus Curtissbacteria bacterium RIFCSPLOWO2_01_FULL_38_11b TaxID=1797725 RepID=A0A1F5H4B4_9BACT|nr:MAG: hypothetical protein A3A49_01765 [Candidatus Curtissbacteria bacterium RIFCSPLOWO2_01_FULL_38_11b]
MKKSAIAKITGISTSAILWLTFASSALAQTSSTSSASKGGTSSSLPAAGSTELTYLLLIGGVVLFVIGAVKLVLSFRE